ncbi:helix-turn-helix domain-containing protein [Nonomuraea sp. NPDC050556]|uniref:helix-turn-helix domain-containing protein n=1 Tax=Nonomuraea sp. NPDC050556 TaxID=3364369 RepID=UPI003788A82A
MTLQTRHQEARLILGTRLHQIRAAAFPTGRALAQTVGWHESKVSRYESGDRMPNEVEIKQWTEACGVPERASELIRLAEGIEAVFAEYCHEPTSDICTRQRSFHPMYRATTQFRILQQTFFPSLLQTERYARAYLTTLNVRSGAVHLEDAIKARMELQQYLQDPEKRFVFILGEAAIRNRVGPPLVMADQLFHVSEIMRQSNLVVGLLPFDVELPFYPWESFWLYDEVEMRADGITKQILVQEPKELAVYARVFGLLAEKAVYGDQAHDMIQKAREHVVQSV